MKSVHWMLVSVLAIGAGCNNSDGTQSSDSASGGQLDSPYVVTSEPAGAVPVGEAAASVKDAQTVTIVGRIGGSSEPFVDGLAAFSIVDPKVPYCAAEEGCPTPWDYCCTQDQVKDHIATVKIVDDSGHPVSNDARQLLGVKELSTVVVQGTTERDEHGNLTVAATKVFVRPSE